MTREEAQRAVENNSTVYCVAYESLLDKTFALHEIKARDDKSVFLDSHDLYGCTPKDAIIDWCMFRIANLTKQIEECKKSVGWDYKIVK
jgi:hypothetical protein